MIIFYTEGGLYLGLGNVFRSLSLADEIKKRKDVEVRFLTSSENYVRDLILSHGYLVEYSERANLLSRIISIQPDILVIDYLNIEESFLCEIRKNTPTRIVVIGNSNSANQYADIVVNAIIGTSLQNRCFVDKGGTLNLWGPRYLVLREEFERIRNTYVCKNSIETIVLLFGGSDQADYTSKVLKQLLLSNEQWQIIVIVGSGYIFLDNLNLTIKSYSKRGKKVELLRNIDNVSEVYSKADFLFTSPGTALFEAMCIGIPAISYFQNDSQRKVFGNFLTTTDFNEENVINDMLSTYDNIQTYQNGLGYLSVGLGRTEIINNILNLLYK